MRHRKKSEKFSRSRAQRNALVKSLLRAVIINERIVTTASKAKGLRGEVDNLITLAKKGSLHHRRLAYRLLEDHRLVKRLFEVVAPRFDKIEGGYTRVLKLGNRKGDGAPISVLELTRMQKKEKKEPKAKKEKDKAKKVSEKKEEKIAPKKEKKPKKGLIAGVRKIFKKERDAL